MSNRKGTKWSTPKPREREGNEKNSAQNSGENSLGDGWREYILSRFELALQLDQFSVLLSIFLVPVSLLSTLLLTSVSLLSILLKPVSRVWRLIPVSNVCIRFNCLRRPGGAGLQVRCHHFFNCQVKSQSIGLEREISTRLGTKMMKMKTPLRRFRIFAIVATTRANLWSYQFIFNLYNFVICWWSVIISGSNESVRRIVLPGQGETL